MVRLVKSNRAFGLIEVLVAIAIIGISIVGLMEMSIFVMRNNLRNEVRNKAIGLLSNHLQKLTSSSYSSIPDAVQSYNYTERVRNIDVKFYIVDNITENTSINTKNIDSKVEWSCCGKKYSYSVETVVSKSE